jgi:hypothetical protein
MTAKNRLYLYLLHKIQILIIKDDHFQGVDGENVLFLLEIADCVTPDIRKKERKRICTSLQCPVKFSRILSDVNVIILQILAAARVIC